MLSGKLIHLIEVHQEQIAANVLREVTCPMPGCRWTCTRKKNWNAV